MQWLFISIAVCGALWFAWARRPVDLFSVAYGSACIYFMPGFLGFALMLPTPARPYKLPIPLVDNAYLVMITVLLCIWIGALVRDSFLRHARGDKAPIMLDAGEVVPMVATALAAMLLVVTFATNISQLLDPNKLNAIQAVGRVHTTMTMAAGVGLVTGYACRQYAFALICFSILVFDMYVGFRFTMAISLIAIAVIYFRRRGPISACRDAGYSILLVLFVGQFFFLYQNIKSPLKSGDLAEVQRRLTDPAWHVGNFATSEPFITQSILNEVIRTDFKAPSDHMTSAVYHFIVFAPELGAVPKTFNDYFQPALYRNVESGVASNIWAQFWSVGGIGAVLFAGLFFALALGAGSALLARCEGALLGAVALLGAGLAFYIQRNELSTLLILEKRIVIVLGICAVGAWFVQKLAQLSMRSSGTTV